MKYVKTMFGNNAWPYWLVIVVIGVPFAMAYGYQLLINLGVIKLY